MKIVQCKKHPRYKAIMPPQCDCLWCWKQYAFTQGLRAVKAEAAHRMALEGKE